MGYDFSADEIFEIACQIERNGARFYLHMAEKISDPAIHQSLLNLAAMEQAHENVFTFMRKSLADQDRKKTIFDPDGETTLYLRSFADIHVFDDEKGADFVISEDLAEDAKMRKILRAAIHLEWESIAFYTGMKDSVPEVLGKGKIDGIIKEEMRHVRLLSENLTSLKG